MDGNDVKNILYECSPKVGISNLIDRSLITVDKNNKIRMHGLLRDMGREIVRQSSEEKPEERSRLWRQRDVHVVLQNQIGKNNATIEGLTLRVDGSKRNSFNIEPIRMMESLRLLQLAGVQSDGDFELDSRKLRWISWHGFTSDRIITSVDHFDEKALVALELESSNLKSMWKETELLNSLMTLKVLNLSHSHGLAQIPDFSYLLNLEKLLLEDCPSLSEISETIGDLTNIRQINLKNCKRLPNLPRSFYKLRSLEELIISGCSKIDKLEEDMVQMENLITLMADNSGIKQVPFLIVRLTSIRNISMCGYEVSSPDMFPSLIWSWMSPTNIVSFAFLVQESVGLLELVSLNAPMLVRSGSYHRKGEKRVLEMLDAAYCRELEARTTSSLIDFPCQFHISGSAKSLLIELGMKSHFTTNLRKMILQELTSKGSNDCMLPLKNCPAWFSFNCESSSVIFEVPPINGHNLRTMMLCIVYSSSLDKVKSCLKTVEIKNHTKCTSRIYEPDMMKSTCHMDIISNMEPGSKVEVSVVPGNKFIVKKATVYLIYDAPIDQTIEQHQEFIEEAPTEEPVMVEDLEKRETKRKPTSITNYEVQPKAPKSQKTTPNVDTLIQEGSHQDQELLILADATDPFPVTVSEIEASQPKDPPTCVVKERQTRREKITSKKRKSANEEEEIEDDGDDSGKKGGEEQVVNRATKSKKRKATSIKKTKHVFTIASKAQKTFKAASVRTSTKNSKEDRSSTQEENPGQEVNQGTHNTINQTVQESSTTAGQVPTEPLAMQIVKPDTSKIKNRPAAEDEEDIDLSFLDFVEPILSATCLDNYTATSSLGSESQSAKGLVPQTPAHVAATTSTLDHIPHQLPVDLLNKLLTLLDHTFEDLVADRNKKKKLVEVGSLLCSCSTIPPSVKKQLPSHLKSFLDTLDKYHSPVEELEKRHAEAVQFVAELDAKSSKMEQANVKILDSMDKLRSRSEEISNKIKELIENKKQVDDLIAKCEEQKKNVDKKLFKQKEEKEAKSLEIKNLENDIAKTRELKEECDKMQAGLKEFIRNVLSGRSV